MSTAELSVIACLCIMLMASGLSRPGPRIRESRSAGYASPRPVPVLVGNQRHRALHPRPSAFARRAI